MKHKISVEIHKQGCENDSFLRMVASVNEGKAFLFWKDVAGYIAARNAQYPTLNNLFFSHADGVMDISEDGGKTTTLTLTWKEVYELGEVDKEIEEELTPATGGSDSPENFPF